MRRRLVQLLAGVGALALAVAMGSAVLGASMLKRGFSANDAPSAIEARLARAMRRMAMPARLKDLPNPLLASAQVLDGARSHWADHCATCHGNDGSGDTMMGRGLYPKPPDMRQPSTQSLTDGELYGVIQNGVRLTGMPAWGKPDELGSTESWALVHFIRHLTAMGPAEMEQMTKMNPKSPDELREEQEEKQFLEGQ